MAGSSCSPFWCCSRPPTGAAEAPYTGCADLITLGRMNPEVIENMIEKGCDLYDARLAAGQARLKADNLEKALEHMQNTNAHKPGQTIACEELGTGHKMLERDDTA